MTKSCQAYYPSRPRFKYDYPAQSPQGLDSLCTRVIKRNAFEFPSISSGYDE